MQTVILAFILVFSNGHFIRGSVADNGWTSIDQCKEDLTALQGKMAANGMTTKAGCFEVSVPKET